MAKHEADSYKGKQHTGKVEDQRKLEHNRIVTGHDPKVKKTKVAKSPQDPQETLLMKYGLSS